MIIFIEHLSREYEDSVALRNKILREPLGLKLEQNQLSAETKDNYYHIGFMINEEVVGILVLKKYTTKFQIFQIAVKEKLQKSGIGRRLVKIGEEIVSENKINEIIVFSRLESIEFYLKLGYISTGLESEIIGLNHLKLFKKI